MTFKSSKQRKCVMAQLNTTKSEKLNDKMKGKRDNPSEYEDEMVMINNTRGRMNAENIYDDLIKFNLNKKGQYNYVYMKMLKDGSYEIGLLKEKSNDKNIIKQFNFNNSKYKIGD